MKVMVTGAGGQLGHDLCETLRAQGVEVAAFDSRALDISDRSAVEAAFSSAHPDWVVNCAAFTHVDKAESETERAFAVNANGAGYIAEAAIETGVKCLHLSTDFVFDGEQRTPYKESDKRQPLGVYGASKAQGEDAVLAAADDHIVLRTAWVYGAHGKNFVRTMLRLAAEREELRVVDDQVGAPTWTRDLAGAIWTLMQAGASGTFHYCNAGECSWHAFACAILEEARQLGFPVQAQKVTAITTDQYPLPARRPAYSRLATNRIEALLTQPIPPWRASLRAMLEELKQCRDC